MGSGGVRSSLPGGVAGKGVLGLLVMGGGGRVVGGVASGDINFALSLNLRQYT